MEQRDFMNMVFKKQVTLHKDSYQNHDKPRDFIDAYLREMEKHEGETNTSFYGNYNQYLYN